MEANSPRQGGGRVWLSIRKRGFPERNVFVRSARNKDELNEDWGKIIVSEEEGSQYPYEQHFHDVTGIITDVKIRKTWIKKKDGTTVPNDNIEVYMTSAGTEVVVNMSFDSLRGKSFAKKFRNIDLSRKVTLDIIDFTNPKGEKIEGLTVLNHYGEEKEQVKAYYDESNLAPPVEEEQRDGGYKMNYTKTNNDLFRKLMDDIMFEFKHGAETDNVHPSEKAPPPATNAYNRDNHRDAPKNDDRRSEPAREERRDDRRDDRREETSRQSDRREPARDERRDEPRRDDRRDDGYSRDNGRSGRDEPRPSGLAYRSGGAGRLGTSQLARLRQGQWSPRSPAPPSKPPWCLTTAGGLLLPDRVGPARQRSCPSLYIHTCMYAIPVLS